MIYRYQIFPYKGVCRITNKEKVFLIVKEFTGKCKDVIGDEVIGTTAKEISRITGLKRNMVSHLLNELNKELKVIKVNTRPVYFIDRDIFQEKTKVTLSGNLIFEGFQALKQAVYKR